MAASTEKNSMFDDIDSASTAHLAKAAKAQKEGKPVEPTKTKLKDGTTVTRN